MSAALSVGLCAGAPAQAAEMSFRLESLVDQGKCRENCPQVIAAEGEIVESTPQDFVDFVREHVRDVNLRSVVFINSQGGRVVASMELGHALRRIGAATVVARIQSDGGESRFISGACLSACVYAFMGGKQRVVPPQSRIGVHRMFTNEVESSFFGPTTVRHRYDDGSMAKMLEDYSARMGVSRELVRHAEQTSSSTIHLVTSAEMSRWRLARKSL
jgi:hypothetical protein